MTDAEALTLKIADPVEYRVAGDRWVSGLVYRVRGPYSARGLRFPMIRPVVVLIRTRPGRYPNGRMAPLVRRRPSRLRKIDAIPEGWFI